MDAYPNLHLIIEYQIHDSQDYRSIEIKKYLFLLNIGMYKNIFHTIYSIFQYCQLHYFTS
jgi:hypothetical protein